MVVIRDLEGEEEESVDLLYTLSAGTEAQVQGLRGRLVCKS